LLAPARNGRPDGRILVVDDELLIRWSLCEALRDHGYVVTEAPDGTSALLALRGGGPLPDVVLLDFRLPDSNSLELLSKIRTLAPKARVILMTAFTTPDVVEGAMQRGAYDVVAKPFEMQALASLIGRARMS
jgi:DNA-binding NtrC family response regulator